MLPRFLLHSSLFFTLTSTSIWVAAHTDPKIDEFSEYNWYGSISIRTPKIFIAKADNFQAQRLPTVTHLWSPNVSASTAPLNPSISSSSSRFSSLTNLKLLLTKNLLNRGIGDSLAVGYNLTSGAANSCSNILNGGVGSCSAQIVFEPSAGPCYNLFRDSEDNMVHDISFSPTTGDYDSCTPEAEAPSGNS